MATLTDYYQKLDNSQTIAYSLIRIFLGIALFVRGVMLVSNPGAIFVLEGDANLHMFYSYITIIHIIGGFMMTIGLFTRIGALMQIPILFSAVFIVHAKNGLMMGGQSLELAALVLFLLLIYFIFGGGSLGVNRFIKFNLN